VNEAAPSTARGAFHVMTGDFNGPLWMWMNTQDVYVRSALNGIVVPLGARAAGSAQHTPEGARNDGAKTRWAQQR
jgi:hypothetical protein